MKQRHAFLIVTEDSPKSYSPAGERVRHIALASSSFFERVIILALRASRYQKEGAPKSKVLLYGLNRSRGLPYPLSAFFDPLKSTLLFICGCTVSWRYKPAYILASMPPLEAGISAWLLAKLSHANLIIDLRDDWEACAKSQVAKYIPVKLFVPLFKLAKRIYSSSICIFAATQTIATTTREHIVNTSIRYVPNGADTSLFQPEDEETQSNTRSKYSLPSEKVIVVYVGSGINPYYRFDAVLHAVKALSQAIKERVFFLFYVYNGIENLNKLKEQLKLTNGLVEIRKPLLRSSLAEVLAACDVGLVPFDNKSYLLCARSTKLYEYLSSGECVVCSGPIGGELDTLISKCPNLGVFTQPTVDGFVHAFSKIMRNAQAFLSDDMKSLRHRFVKENFDRKKTMMKAMEILLD